MYTKSYDEKQTENKKQNVTVSEHEFTTSSDRQNSQNNNGKHGSSGGSSSHGSAQKQKTASQKETTTAAAPVTTAAPITTEKAKVFDDIFVYSEATKKVHSRSCPYVKGIDENNYYYINANEADKLFDEGYEFCSYCKGYVINE